MTKTTSRAVRVALAAMALWIGGLFPIHDARADTMTWQLRSFHPNAVQVKFYSQNRKAVWPGGTSHYPIRDSKVNSFKLTCIAGERICYGASVSGNARRTWGLGADGKQRCTACCYTCKGNTTTPVHNLNDR
jgi:hypothetical protein